MTYEAKKRALLTFMLAIIYNTSIKVNRERGIYMTQQAAVMDFVRNGNGMITTAKAVEKGISRGVLGYMVQKGTLLRVSRGVYALPEVWEDEFLNLQSQFKRGIFSHATALFLWDLTDRAPLVYYMTFPTNYNLSNPKREGIRCFQAKQELYSLGAESTNSPAGNSVRCYSAERTLCDILRPNYDSDIQMITEAYKRYAQRSQKNVPLLSEYAQRLGVEKRVRAYLEVLL